MKFSFVFFLVTTCLFVLSCNSENSDNIQNSQVNNSPKLDIKDTLIGVDQYADSVEGDFNGDGKREFMSLEIPKLGEDDMSCVGNCESTIVFSDKTIPTIKVDNCIFGSLVNEGDLNGNGSDEIGLLPGWFTSCWHTYLVWTFKKGRWIYAVDPISTHCNQWEKGADAIEKDNKREGYVIIRYSEITDADFVILSKSVKIRK